MLLKLNELMQNVELVRAQQEQEAATRTEKKKKKVRRRKKKANTAEDTSPERGRSPSPSHQIMSFPVTPPNQFVSPSAHKSSYSLRPHSALLTNPNSRSLDLGRPAAMSLPGNARPLSANRLPVRPSTATPTGPSARAAADAHWRDVSPPKYTATSLKQPELGTVPGKYVSPPWKPLVTNDRDPTRQEINQPIKESRFKHVLAVPAHVLAQSFFHPDYPSAQSRAKQLSEDLRVARMDRYLVIKERTKAEQEAKEALELCKSMESAIRQLTEENYALKDQLSGVLQSQKALSFERDQLAEQLRLYKGTQ